MNKIINKNEVEEIKILKYKNGLCINTKDIVVSEVNLVVTLQCELLGTFTCTPTYLRELVAGYLVSAGIVSEKNALIHLDYIEAKSKFDVTLEDNGILKKYKYKVQRPTGCASGDMIFIRKNRQKKTKTDLHLHAFQVHLLMQEFNKSSELFKATGGVHSAAIAENDNIIVFMEDIGRHNAVDKTIGHLYLSKIELTDKILLSSGRISSEIVQKAINAGIQMIISRSAPTLKGIELAKNNNITLIGFARSRNFNIYSHFERIIF